MDARTRQGSGRARNRARRGVLLVVTGLFLVGMGAPALAAEKLTIIHTNDLHSHLLGFGPNGDYTIELDNDATIGGFARIAARVEEIRAAREAEGTPVLLLDGGDFMMGTAFSLLRGQAELTLMDALGYDVITLGNHEFDWTPSETAKILGLIGDLGLDLKVVASNLIFDADSPLDDSLEALCGEDNLIQPAYIQEVDGTMVGFFGLVGENAAGVAPFAYPVDFEAASSAAARAVSALEDAGAQLIVCLSHSGLDEDTALAGAVPGIDVIISGHTHEIAQEPLVVGDTLIVQAGSYGRYLGVLDLDLTGGAPAYGGYELVDINDTIAGDAAMQALVEGLVGEVDLTLETLGYDYAFGQIIAETAFDLTAVSGAENNLGNLVADAMRWMVDQEEYDPAVPESRVDFAVESNGVIRDDILAGVTGQIAFSDAFRVLPLGFGLTPDGQGNPPVGYPMVTIHITASEVKKAMEVITTVYPLEGSDYWLNVSGLKFEYNPSLLPFFRVLRIYVGDETNGYSEKPLDTSCLNKELYKVAINYYVAQFIAVVGDYTYGFLSIDPKDADGVSYLDASVHPGGLSEARVDCDPDTAGVQELQQWEGFVRYLLSFDTGGDGIPDVPARYAAPTGRIQEGTCFIATAGG